MTTLTEKQIKEAVSIYYRHYNEPYKWIRVTPLTFEAIKHLSENASMTRHEYVHALLIESWADWATPCGIEHIKQRRKFGVTETVRIFKEDFETLNRLAKANHLPIGIILEDIIAFYGDELPYYNYKYLRDLRDELFDPDSLKGETNNA